MKAVFLGILKHRTVGDLRALKQKRAGGLGTLQYRTAEIWGCCNMGQVRILGQPGI